MTAYSFPFTHILVNMTELLQQLRVLAQIEAPLTHIQLRSSDFCSALIVLAIGDFQDVSCSLSDAR